MMIQRSPGIKISAPRWSGYFRCSGAADVFPVLASTIVAQGLNALG